MEMREISRRPPGSHFVDIHKVPEEEEEEEEVKTPSKSTAQKHEKRSNVKLKRPYNPRSLRKQVSLETGFSALNGEKSERKSALPRSGKSFAGFGSSHAINSAELGRKGDFNIFRTKSNLVRQSSKVPLRKESGIDNGGQFNDVFGSEVDECVNKSVPAGRYFAALTGPELDQVKVVYMRGVPHRMLRHMAGLKQPSHLVGRLSHKIPPHPALDQSLDLAPSPSRPNRRSVSTSSSPRG